MARYQVKCAARPIVDYERFLELFKEGKEADVTVWWMAANVEGEPRPAAPGAAERFAVTGVPPGARYFAVASFDDSWNRSPIGNVAEAGR